jgi:hypothetical protein
MSKYRARRPHRWSASSLPVLGLLACAACGSTDGAMLLRPGAGTGGSTAGAGGTSGGSGGGASGSGGVTEPDAGAEATRDASSERSCVVGSIGDYCSKSGVSCPATYAQARAGLQTYSSQLRLILQEACTAPDGSPRIRVSGDYRSRSVSYIFDPAAVQLVSVYIYDDTGGCSDPVGSDTEAFGSVPGFYGEEASACAFQYSSYTVPPSCRLPADWRNLDAGALRAALVDAGADAGSLADGGPYECVLAP